MYCNQKFTFLKFYSVLLHYSRLRVLLLYSKTSRSELSEKTRRLEMQN